MLSNATDGRSRAFGRTVLAGLLGATALVSSTTAFAQTAPVSQNATVNLINKLVEKKILTRAEADTMIAQADAEASQARATAEAAQTAQQSAQSAVAAASPASAQPGTSVRYVPQFVRDQIREEVTREVLADAKTQGLVAPDAMPDWVRGIKITGDLRLREENHFFDKGNALDFININAINGGPPYNTDPTTNPVNFPILNTRKDRNYFRIRARIGLEANIDPKLTLGFRLATGDQNSPVSTNANLGGYFNNKSIWLDRAYVDYHPVDGLNLTAGRIRNPFRLNELVWDEDVNLDGIAVSLERSLGNSLKLFALGGAFPLDFVGDAAPNTALSNLKDSAKHDKWLFAGQIGGQWQASEQLNTSLYAAYYHYKNIEGDLSPACDNQADFCLTDYSRPGFGQRGNTLFAIRDNTTTNPANTANPQYYGLASAFHILDVSGDVDWAFDNTVHLNLTGHFAKNLGYNRADVLARGFNALRGISQIANNNETCTVAPVGGICPAGKSLYQSGSTAWLVRATLGTAVADQPGLWNITASYRRMAPDALLDAFTDSDFHLGGTNAKGWTIGGQYGLLRNTSIGARWLSAQEVSGPPFKVDVLQIDLNTRF
ncbi:MAG: putative porin [Candidatus Sphingomonas phytovorans]|nr:putative porin [Sphingomonas sp.]WEK02142.1 MAG: putative porin [Sphingomonas sp.]